MPRFVVALGVATGFAVSQAEILTPELHDGDSAAALAAVGAASNGQAPTAPPTHQPDDRHACHCAHAHTLWIDGSTSIASDIADRAGNIPAANSAPRSIAIRPHLRPPIA